MVEFSEDFSTKYSGKPALMKRIEARLAVERGVIPFSNYGVDYGLFDYSHSDFVSSVNRMFADMDVSVTFTQGRVTVAGMSFNVGSGGASL